MYVRYAPVAEQFAQPNYVERAITFCGLLLLLLGWVVGETGAVVARSVGRARARAKAEKRTNNRIMSIKYIAPAQTRAFSSSARSRCREVMLDGKRLSSVLLVLQSGTVARRESFDPYISNIKVEFGDVTCFWRCSPASPFINEGGVRGHSLRTQHYSGRRSSVAQSQVHQSRHKCC